MGRAAHCLHPAMFLLKVSPKVVEAFDESAKGTKLMTTIKATCGTCGDVELTVADVQVMINEDDLSASYSFRCPSCAGVVVKKAPGDMIDLLISAGVSYSVWKTPAREVADPKAPLFDHDDVVSFGLMLRDDHAIALALDGLKR